MKGHGVGGGGTERKGERTHGHGQQWTDCEGRGSIRGVDGNGKDAIKNI